MRFASIFLLLTSPAFAESNLDHKSQTKDIFHTDEIIKFISNYDNSNNFIIKKFSEDLNPKQSSNIIEAESTQKLINNDEAMFSADSVTLDHNQNTLTAIGNVSIIFKNMKLSSDKIIYYKSLDEIHAKGKVSLVENSSSE